MATPTITLSDLGGEAREAFDRLSPQTIKYLELSLAGAVKLEAYREAYNYKGKYPDQMVKKVEDRADVKLIIAAYRQALADRFKITPDRIIERYAQMAFADIRQAFDEQGRMIPIDQWPTELANLVAGFDFEALWAGQGPNREQIGETVKVRLINRKDVLDSLARTQGLFVPDKTKGKERPKPVVVPAGQSREEWIKTFGNGVSTKQ